MIKNEFSFIILALCISAAHFVNVEQGRKIQELEGKIQLIEQRK